MKRLTPKDKAVINAFTDKKPAESRKLSSDGTTLDGLWMGGREIAVWKGGKIVLNDLGSRSAQLVQDFLKRNTPRNWIQEMISTINRIPESILDALIEEINQRVVSEYVMPDDEREQQAILKRKLRLTRDHLDALKFLVMSGAINSPNRAVASSDLKAFSQEVLGDLIKHGMIQGVADRRNPRGLPKAYYTNMSGFLMGHAYQRRYVKA